MGDALGLELPVFGGSGHPIPFVVGNEVTTIVSWR